MPCALAVHGDGADVANGRRMTPAAASLRIVIVAPDTLSPDPADPYAEAQAERSRSLRIGMLQSGCNIVAVLPADVFLPERLAQISPDMIIVDAESQARDTLEHVVVATRDARRPVVLFTNDDDTSHVRDAIAAGVTAYVVAGLAPERVKPVLEVAMARFQHEEALRQELADARTQLSERKLIDRAKGILMSRQGLGEDEAYARLRKTAMDKGMRLADVAQRIIDVMDLLA
jgi:response regulator NasT